MKTEIYVFLWFKVEIFGFRIERSAEKNQVFALKFHCACGKIFWKSGKSREIFENELYGKILGYVRTSQRYRVEIF